MDQLDKLEAVARAADRARGAAAKGDLFASYQGLALINALYDLTEVDALYDFAKDIGLPLGVEPDGQRILFLEARP